MMPPAELAREPWLTKRQIAQHYGRSTRWVELRMKEGMPHRKDRDTPNSWVMFRLTEVDAWLAGRAHDAEAS
jgi:hypothetical protein